MGKKEKSKPTIKTPAQTGSAAKDSKKHDKQSRKGFQKKDYTGFHDDLATQLNALGLRIQLVVGDGNCFFRSLADQLLGDQNKHSQVRAQVVDYIKSHRDTFEPFIEDEEPFDTYVARMSRDAQWGGHLELQAASLVLGSNIAVYQEDQPRWVVRNFPEDATILHLAYHGGEHYNSVRLRDDVGPGPAKPINLADGATGLITKPAGSWSHKDEEKIMDRTECYDIALIRQSLEAAGGKVEAAIELVFAEMHGGEAQDTDNPGLEQGTAGPSADVEGDLKVDLDLELAIQLALDDEQEGYCTSSD